MVRLVCIGKDPLDDANNRSRRDFMISFCYVNLLIRLSGIFAFGYVSAQYVKHRLSVC